MCCHVFLCFIKDFMFWPNFNLRCESLQLINFLSSTHFINYYTHCFKESVKLFFHIFSLAWFILYNAVPELKPGINVFITNFSCFCYYLFYAISFMLLIEIQFKTYKSSYPSFNYYFWHAFVTNAHILY